MTQFKSAEEAAAAGKYVRTVRSFVKREGRLTKGQAAAIERHWPAMGLSISNGQLDLTEVFGNNNPVTFEIGFGMGHSLVEMAKQAPERNFIGVEVHEPGVGACLADLCGRVGTARSVRDRCAGHTGLECGDICGPLSCVRTG